jgi:flavorubredoxin
LAQEYYRDYFAMLPDADRYTGSRIVDYPFSAFLIVDEHPLLIDTCGPRQQTAALQAIEHILAGRSLGYIWISHVELPHAGNTPTLKRRYPEAQIITVAGGENYQLHALHNARMVSPGETINLGRRSVEMVDALFVDHGLSQWLYESESKFLFTADWGHNLHAPAYGECFQFLDEMLDQKYTEELYIDDVRVNAWYQFPWLAWTEPDELAAAIRQLFQKYQVNIFAPSHGSIIRHDFGRFIPLLIQGMTQAAAMPFSHTL